MGTVRSVVSMSCAPRTTGTAPLYPLGIRVRGGKQSIGNEDQVKTQKCTSLLSHVLSCLLFPSSPSSSFVPSPRGDPIPSWFLTEAAGAEMAPSAPSHLSHCLHCGAQATR